MVGVERLVIPNLCAVTLPKTVTGISDKSLVINLPSIKFPPITSKSSELVIIVDIPPPSNSEIKLLLRTSKSAVSYTHLTLPTTPYV